MSSGSAADGRLPEGNVQRMVAEMKMWRFKSCPRCSGDTFIDSDVDGWYEHCLMCGHSRDLPAEAVGKSPAAAGNRDRTDSGGTKSP